MFQGEGNEADPVCLAFVTSSPATLQDFYHEVANPLLLRVAFEYPSDTVEDITQDSFQHHFKGSEMVVAGKLKDNGPDVLSAKVSGQMVSMAESSRSEGATGAAWGNLCICSQRDWAQVPVLPNSSQLTLTQRALFLRYS